jgi:eukaryotic-like serine/threonine-protein kinase
MANIPQQIGNYKIERQIGKGGMSQVWLARHRTLEDRLVAVKLLIAQDQEWEERFGREANITSRLRHECIVQIYDHGYHPPYHYTVMEYVPGGALRDLLRDRRPLPLDTALHVLRRAGAALDYAHAHGVTHRDVSPGNILIEQSSGRVLLTDFGIARETGKAGMTTINKVMGTPGYLSPEHASSATAVTHLSDIYSLGVVLFEMLSGTLPWDHTPGVLDPSGGPFAPPLPLRSRGVEGLPYEVDRILQTMLALDPAKRYPSAQAAIEDLDRVLRRHTMTTTIIPSGAEAGKASAGRPPLAAPAPPLPPPVPVEPHPVEKALGLDLLKAPMQEARRLADQLADPQEIAALLDQWSREGLFRRKLLGRQARLRRVQSQNVYFYTLRVLYETREPERLVEEPDRKATPIPREKVQDRWTLELPAPKGFVDEPGGTVRLPGSTRVLTCGPCQGVGQTTCARCKGAGRVVVARSPSPQAAQGAAPGGGVAQAVTATAARGAKAPVEAAAGATALVPCPECQGTGGLKCQQCDGVGRLVQHKTTQWRRRPVALETNDDLPRVDEQWLHKVCQARDVYRERHTGGFRPEWSLVPGLAEVVKEAEKRLDADTKVAMSELSITFIPVTEIVFDLGDVRQKPPPAQPAAGKGKGAPKAPAKPAVEAGLYRWHIYGFERRLPKDWRFLNWDRVTTMILVAVAVVLALLLAMALLLR